MDALLLKLVNMSIAATWLVGIVFLLRLVLKKAPKWIHCLLWVLVAVRLVCPFSLESHFSMIPSREVLPQTVISGPSFDVTSGIQIIDQPVNDFLGERYFEGVTVPANNGSNVMSVLALVWLGGMILMAVYAFTSYARLKKKVAPSVSIGEDIRLCDYIDTPFILGIIKPKIYLPSAIEQNTASYVLAHERAHIRRRDHWWKPLGFALLTVYWFNPVMWLAYLLLCRDIELACDEKVIRQMRSEDKKLYSEALLSCSVSRRWIAACPLAFGEVGVKERVKSVLNYKKPAFWIIFLAVITCAVVAVCFLTDPVTEPNDQTDQEEGQAAFYANVLRVSGESLLVQPEEGSGERRSSDRIWVSLRSDSAESMPAVRSGDEVRIVYDGMIAESYPAQINGAYAVHKVSGIITDDIHEQILSALETDSVTYFDCQKTGDYLVAGCQYGNEFGLVYLKSDGSGYVLDSVIPQERMNAYADPGAWWDGTVEGRQTYLIANEKFAGLYIPGDEGGALSIFDYPAVLTVDSGLNYQFLLEPGMFGYIPSALGEVFLVRNFANIHLPQLEGWEYECLNYTDESTPFGISFRPEGETGWITVEFCPDGVFGVCGTGLLVADGQLSNGYAFSMGFYDGSDTWSYMHFGNLPGTYVAVNEGADEWLKEREEEVMNIFANMTLACGVITWDEAYEITKTAVQDESYSDIKGVFDYIRGVWSVEYSKPDEDLVFLLEIDAEGNLLYPVSWNE